MTRKQANRYAPQRETLEEKLARMDAMSEQERAAFLQALFGRVGTTKSAFSS